MANGIQSTELPASDSGLRCRLFVVASTFISVLQWFLIKRHERHNAAVAKGFLNHNRRSGRVTADTSLTIPVPGGTAFQKGEEADKGSIGDNTPPMRPAIEYPT